MEKFRDIRVKYNHPAIPPVGVGLGKVYTIGYLIDNYNLNELSIKQMFIPVEGKWEDLENKQPKIRKREMTVEDIDKTVEI